MNLAAFQARFPEFRTADPAMVQVVLDEAATELNAAEIGAAFDAAHGQLAAHKLAISPFGRAARMLNEKGESTYQAHFADIMARAIVAIDVT